MKIQHLGYAIDSVENTVLDLRVALAEADTPEESRKILQVLNETARLKTKIEALKSAMEGDE